MAKRRTDNRSTGAAIAGAGASATGVGYVAGGVPGRKVNVNGSYPKAMANGGILGFRTKFHEGGLYGFKQQKLHDDLQKKPTKSEKFFHGYNAGKIQPEKDIINGMKAGRKLAHSGVVGGAAVTAYGVSRMRRRDTVKKADRRKSYAAAAGAGGSAAVIAHGAGGFLKDQGAQHHAAAGIFRGEAQRLVPGVTRPGQVKRNPELLNGVGRKTAKVAGRLHGAAAQHQHFGEVFDSTAKVVRGVRAPAAAVGAVGVGGLIAEKRRVKKSFNTSAFGVDHG